MPSRMMLSSSGVAASAGTSSPPPSTGPRPTGSPGRLQPGVQPSTNIANRASSATLRRCACFIVSNSPLRLNKRAACENSCLRLASQLVVPQVRLADTTDVYDPFARGPFPVGVRTLHLSRGARELPCELWYPATPANFGLDLSPV